MGMGEGEVKKSKWEIEDIRELEHTGYKAIRK
jgi:hypothetical protein